jgi:hypothetical protein
MAQRAIDLPAIEAEIERIRSLGLDALRARWRSMFGAMPPVALTKDLIARMMIYRVQEEAFGGLDRSTRRLLDGMAQGEKPGTDARRRLKAGTVLVREYQGQRHRGAAGHERGYSALRLGGSAARKGRRGLTALRPLRFITM